MSGNFEFCLVDIGSDESASLVSASFTLSNPDIPQPITSIDCPFFTSASLCALMTQARGSMKVL